VVARLKKVNRYKSVSVHTVPGDRAAKPDDPTVRPTKALSIILSKGDARNIPRAGTANFSMLRLLARVVLMDDVDDDEEEEDPFISDSEVTDDKRLDSKKSGPSSSADVVVSQSRVVENEGTAFVDNGEHDDTL
jgi:hypothetical protein